MRYKGKICHSRLRGNLYPYVPQQTEKTDKGDIEKLCDQCEENFSISIATRELISRVTASLLSNPCKFSPIAFESKCFNAAIA